MIFSLFVFKCNITSQILYKFTIISIFEIFDFFSKIRKFQNFRRLIFESFTKYRLIWSRMNRLHKRTNLTFFFSFLNLIVIFISTTQIFSAYIAAHFYTKSWEDWRRIQRERLSHLCNERLPNNLELQKKNKWWVPKRNEMTFNIDRLEDVN